MEINQISLKKALKETFSVFSRNFGKILIFALLVYLPIAVIQVFFFNSVSLEDVYQALSAAESGSEEAMASLSAYSGKVFAYFAGLVLMNLFSLLYTAAITKITSCDFFGIKISGTDVFDSAIRLFPKMILTQLLCYIFAVVGFMLCFFPGVVFAIVFSQSVYLVVLTGMWKMQAMKLSEKLVRRNTILIVILLLLNMGFTWVLEYVFGWISVGLISLTGLTGTAADIVIIVLYTIQYFVSALMIIFSVNMLLQIIKRNTDLDVKLTDETVVVRSSI